MVSKATPTSRSPDLILESWEFGPHAQADSDPAVQGDPDCARCHSPLAGMQMASVDSRVAGLDGAGSSGVGCAVCHPGQEDDSFEAIAWLAKPGDGRYESVESVRELCEKCHLAGEVEGHLSVVVAGVHSEQACIDCHDAHDGSASCTGSGCHQPFRAECEPIETHDKPHAVVSCEGCHASGKAAIDWDEDREVWQTFYPVMKDGETQLVAYPSHELSLEVDCDRCHTPGEIPWGIK